MVESFAPPLYEDPGVPGQKTPVYRAVVVPTLLCGAETSVLYRKQIRLFERFHQRCLCSILGIRWQDYVSNEEVLKKASLPSMESILLQVQLRLGWPRPKQSSSSSSKKESVIVALQESVARDQLKREPGV